MKNQKQSLTPRLAAVGLGGQGAGVPTPLEESGDLHTCW